MDAELKTKWLEALRSGKYDQGTGQLRNGNCFCCLGVLCDIFDPNAWKIDRNSNAEWSYGEGFDQSHEIGVLPHNFKVTYGISADVESDLIAMNDDSGRTLSQIADYIEAKL